MPIKIILRGMSYHPGHEDIWRVIISGKPYLVLTTQLSETRFKYLRTILSSSQSPKSPKSIGLSSKNT
jgi:hypothetical protein